MSDGYIKVGTGLDNSAIPQDLQELNNLIEKGSSLITDKMTKKIDSLNRSWSKLSEQQEKNNAKIKEFRDQLSTVSKGELKIQSLETERGGLQKEIYEAQDAMQQGSMAVSEFNSLLEQSQSRAKEINAEIENLKNTAQQVDVSKINEGLRQAETRSDGLQKEMEGVRNDAVGLKSEIGKTDQNAKKLDNTTKKIGNSMGQVASGAQTATKNMGNGIKTLARYTLALFSIRTAYNGIQKAVNAWMSATEEGAQAQADIQYIWQSLGQTIAPIIQSMIGLMRQLLGYANAVSKSLFGFELFTKSANKNLNNSVSNAKELRKQLAGFDEMNVLGSNGQQNLSGNTNVIPNPIDSAMNPVLERAIENIKEIIRLLGEPLKNISFDNLSLAFSNLWTAMLPLIDEGGKFLYWLYTDVLVPLAEWTIENLLPEFLNLVTSALGAVNKIIQVFKPSFEWLWDNVLVPLATYTGEAIISFLGFLGQLFESFGNWIESDGNLLVWLWEEVLVPFAGYVGTNLTDFMKLLNQLFQDFTNWISSNQGLMNTFFNSLTGFLGTLVLYWTAAKVKAFLEWMPAAFATLKYSLSQLNIPLLIAGAGFALLVAGIIAVATNWSKMSGMERIVSILGLLTIAATTAAVAVGALQSAWTLGVAAVAIAAGVAAIVWSVNSANSRAKASAKEAASLPRMAHGGVVSRSTVAEIGEAGKEAVIPLQNNTQWAEDFLGVLNSYGGSFGGSNQPNITVVQLDSKEIARYTKEAEKDDEFRTNGGLKYGY